LTAGLASGRGFLWPEEAKASEAARSGRERSSQGPKARAERASRSRHSFPSPQRHSSRPRASQPKAQGEVGFRQDLRCCHNYGSGAVGSCRLRSCRRAPAAAAQRSCLATFAGGLARKLARLGRRAAAGSLNSGRSRFSQQRAGFLKDTAREGFRQRPPRLKASVAHTGCRQGLPVGYLASFARSRVSVQQGSDDKLRDAAAAPETDFCRRLKAKQRRRRVVQAS
jgi:hypothetical protein